MTTNDPSKAEGEHAAWEKGADVSAGGTQLKYILRIQEYGKGEREFPIASPAVQIGRDPQGEVVLADREVSRCHVRLRVEGRRVVLEDLGSLNGTFVNQKKVVRGGTLLLRDRDVIQLGRSLLQLVLRWTGRLLRTMASVQRSSPPSTSASETGSEDEASKVSLLRLDRLEAKLLVPGGSGSGVECFELQTDRVRIGRSERSQVVLDDPTVAAEHAEIFYNKEGFHLIPLDPGVETSADGVSQRLVPLHDESFIQIGALQALFLVREEGQDPLEPSFSLKDHLLALFPERAEAIQDVFRTCREQALGFAEELIRLGELTPKEWWEASSRVEPRRQTRGFLGRFFSRGKRK